MSQATTPDTPAAASTTGCDDIAELTRLRYFHGRALGAVDLQREQAYHVETARLHNRLLHGWGIVCGLDVGLVEAGECDPEHDGRPPPSIIVGPGTALDCQGNTIVVRRPRTLNLRAMLGPEALRVLAEEPVTVYVTICFHEELIDPSRPLLAAKCEPVAACEYGRVRETYRICVSTEAPDPGPACEPCCGACGSACLLLAAITCFTPEGPLQEDQIVLEGRRPLARHDLAEIAEINWVHGATYKREDATALLAEGLRVRFSRPVRVASLREHVVELTTIEGGGGRSAAMYSVDGEFVGLPAEPLIDAFAFRSTTDETLQYGDRVLITIHGDFILDECCRAVDANHVGGRVPTMHERPADPISCPEGLDCPPRPTGNGTEGGQFVSWIFVEEKGGKR